MVFSSVIDLDVSALRLSAFLSEYYFAGILIMSRLLDIASFPAGAFCGYCILATLPNSHSALLHFAADCDPKAAVYVQRMLTHDLLHSKESQLQKLLLELPSATRSREVPIGRDEQLIFPWDVFTDPMPYKASDIESSSSESSRMTPKAQSLAPHMLKSALKTTSPTLIRSTPLPPTRQAAAPRPTPPQPFPWPKAQHFTQEKYPRTPDGRMLMSDFVDSKTGRVYSSHELSKPRKGAIRYPRHAQSSHPFDG
jgi:hypothetical protein